MKLLEFSLRIITIFLTCLHFAGGYITRSQLEWHNRLTNEITYLEYAINKIFKIDANGNQIHLAGNGEKNQILLKSADDLIPDARLISLGSVTDISGDALENIIYFSSCETNRIFTLSVNNFSVQLLAGHYSGLPGVTPGLLDILGNGLLSCPWKLFTNHDNDRGGTYFVEKNNVSCTLRLLSSPQQTRMITPVSHRLNCSNLGLEGVVPSQFQSHSFENYFVSGSKQEQEQYPVALTNQQKPRHSNLISLTVANNLCNTNSYCNTDLSNMLHFPPYTAQACADGCAGAFPASNYFLLYLSDCFCVLTCPSLIVLANTNMYAINGAPCKTYSPSAVPTPYPSPTPTSATPTFTPIRNPTAIPVPAPTRAPTAPTFAPTNPQYTFCLIGGYCADYSYQTSFTTAQSCGVACRIQSASSLYFSVVGSTCVCAPTCLNIHLQAGAFTYAIDNAPCRTLSPTAVPTAVPTFNPTRPSSQPTSQPSLQPFAVPSSLPTNQPTSQPLSVPSSQPTSIPSNQPTVQPSSRPSNQPSGVPSSCPTVQPSTQPSTQPSRQPSGQPSSRPSTQPTSLPSSLPSGQPSSLPSRQPSTQPTSIPSVQPTSQPSSMPSRQPSSQPSGFPSSQPTAQPTRRPSAQPSSFPTTQPTIQPTSQPTGHPSRQPTSFPSTQPTSQPSSVPTTQPSTQPTRQPSSQPSRQPSSRPSGQPSSRPTNQPTQQPSAQPSSRPSTQPTGIPTRQPTRQPTSQPSTQPTGQPTTQPSSLPTGQPSSQPSGCPTTQPSVQPTCQPSAFPSRQPSAQPTSFPSGQPTGFPTSQPTSIPSTQPSSIPTCIPTSQPTNQPSGFPSNQPSSFPSGLPTNQPTSQPSCKPSGQPTSIPSEQPSTSPTTQPTRIPTGQPTSLPTSQPSSFPSNQPTSVPSGLPTDQPSLVPSAQPSSVPSSHPTNQPTSQPWSFPSSQPTILPSNQPTSLPSGQPSTLPTMQPSSRPSLQPTSQPSSLPSNQPSSSPTMQPSITPSSQPSSQPTIQPTGRPSTQPTVYPSSQPSVFPTAQPSAQPSSFPSRVPSSQPTLKPTSQPTVKTDPPTFLPTIFPTSHPTTPPFRKLFSSFSVDHQFTTRMNGFSFFPGRASGGGGLLSATKDFSLRLASTNATSFIIFGDRNIGTTKEGVITLNEDSAVYSPQTVVSTQSQLYSTDISRSIMNIQDINGDSLPDLAVGYPEYSIVAVYYGSPTSQGFFNLTVSFLVVGETSSDGLGYSIAPAGNTRQRKDSFNDFVVCALYRNRCYMIYGRRNSPDIDLGNFFPKSAGYRIDGTEGYFLLGLSLSFAHDFNQDHFPDLAITAMSKELQVPVIFILFGGQPPDSNLLLNNSFQIITSTSQNAGYSISGLGDINGDGFDDLAIGSVPYRGGYQAQTTFVIFGRNITRNSNATEERSLSLTKFKPTDGFRIAGGGFSVTGTGDLNGDGINDLVVSNYPDWYLSLKGNTFFQVFPSNITSSPTLLPSSSPSSHPSSSPTIFIAPTDLPSSSPSLPPTRYIPVPSRAPTTRTPTKQPSFIPTPEPSATPSFRPTMAPTEQRTFPPTTRKPSFQPSYRWPTSYPTIAPSNSNIPEQFTPVASLSPGFNNFTEAKSNLKFVLDGSSGDVTILGAVDRVNYYSFKPISLSSSLSLSSSSSSSRGVTKHQSSSISSHAGTTTTTNEAPARKSRVTLPNFSLKRDKIDLTSFPALGSVADLAYRYEPLRIYLSAEQDILFPSLGQPSLDLQEMIIFRDPSSISSDQGPPFVIPIVVFVVIALVVGSIILFLCMKSLLREEKVAHLKKLHSKENQFLSDDRLHLISLAYKEDYKGEEGSSVMLDSLFSLSEDDDDDDDNALYGIAEEDDDDDDNEQDISDLSQASSDNDDDNNEDGDNKTLLNLSLGSSHDDAVSNSKYDEFLLSSLSSMNGQDERDGKDIHGTLFGINLSSDDGSEFVDYKKKPKNHDLFAVPQSKYSAIYNSWKSYFRAMEDSDSDSDDEVDDDLEGNHHHQEPTNAEIAEDINVIRRVFNSSHEENDNIKVFMTMMLRQYFPDFYNNNKYKKYNK
jgi:hypothetical protein